MYWLGKRIKQVKEQQSRQKICASLNHDLCVDFSTGSFVVCGGDDDDEGDAHLQTAMCDHDRPV